MKYLEKKLTLRVSECDVNGLWRPGAMMIEMQEAAGEHSASMGCGREDLTKLGLAWVVARMELQMGRYPAWGEEVTVHTFHRPHRHRFFPRYFDIRDGEGRTVCLGSSLWLLMDLETRQSVNADRLLRPLPYNGDMPETIPLPKGITQLETPEKSIPYRAVYTDLDANGHVNNTKYVDWLCNVLGSDTLTAHPIETLTIHFDSEIRPEQPVDMRLKRDGMQYQLTGIHEGKAAFDIGGTLRTRP